MAKKRTPGAKLGRPPKPTRALTIELHPRAYAWLEVLRDKGRFGNSVENVAIDLLNDRFKQLLQEGELFEGPFPGTAIPFPHPKENSGPIDGTMTEQPSKAH